MPHEPEVIQTIAGETLLEKTLPIALGAVAGGATKKQHQWAVFHQTNGGCTIYTETPLSGWKTACTTTTKKHQRMEAHGQVEEKIHIAFYVEAHGKALQKLCESLIVFTGTENWTVPIPSAFVWRDL